MFPSRPAGLFLPKCTISVILRWNTCLANGYSCIIYLGVDDFVIVISTLAIQVILQLRVYALYERSKQIRLFLLICCSIEIMVMAIFLGLTLAHISELPVISTPTGCYYSGIFAISVFFWLPALVFEPVLCLLVVWKAWGDDLRALLRRLRSNTVPDDALSAGTVPLIKVFARDSIIFFVGIFIELLISTVIWAHYNEYINIAVPWSGALPSLLGSRLYLHMREALLFPERYHMGAANANDCSGYALSTWAPAAPTLQRSTELSSESDMRHGRA